MAQKQKWWGTKNVLETAFLWFLFLDFALTFLDMWKKNLIRKLGLTSNFMASDTGKQIITIHILPNISRSKDNQTMKFCELVEYNMRKNFLQK